MKQKVLVTGGAGYIGAHTVVELQEHGYEVVIIDDLSNSRIEVIDAIYKITGIKPKFEQLDLCDHSKLKGFFEKHKNILAAIHFAASKKVGESVAKPLKYYHNNLLSTIHLLQEMDKRNIKKFVFSSSCTVYGEPDESPVTEDAPLKPAISPYGSTKRICEEIIKDQTAISGLKAISLRYFNPIGAHPSTLIGSLPMNDSDNLMPAITQTAIGKRDVLKVYGNDYSTVDGSCIRDYIHVTDIA